MANEIATTDFRIAGTLIRRDSEGRFCLNDCHAASGGDPAKRPANWMRTARAKALIEELHSSDLRSGDEGACSDLSRPPVVIVNDGISNGTYAVKELVYAYASWMEPKFELMVIRAFDALVHGKIGGGWTDQMVADEINRRLTVLQSDLICATWGRSLVVTETIAALVNNVRADRKYENVDSLCGDIPASIRSERETVARLQQAMKALSIASIPETKQ